MGIALPGYQINAYTTALLPIAHIDYDTIAIERDQELFIRKTPHQLISLAYLNHCSTYEGRRQAVMHHFDFKRKVPIPINPSGNLFAFPTHAPADFVCSWIFYSHVEALLPTPDFSKNTSGQTMIIFKNGRQLQADVSHYVLEMVMGLESTDASTTAKLNQEIEKNEELTSQIKSLEEDNDSPKLELEELNSNKKKVDDELESHESKLTESKNTIDDLNAELEEKTGKIEELQDENASLQADVEDLESTIASAEIESSNTSSASTSTTSSNIYYKKCTEARNAGAAPVYAGDPGYASHLDRDGDGDGCE